MTGECPGQKERSRANSIYVHNVHRNRPPRCSVFAVRPLLLKRQFEDEDEQEYSRVLQIEAEWSNFSETDAPQFLFS